ncbi:hypothetical protein [Microbispora sp. NBRC 16548]|uniref:hypothetical protein n=1 Tax=Microbispora sp. NBRC 16548 TaxID=3030994 RepID=UPI0024A39184|nr:hypothetical protein [Microbispora sp. NBRC 16548]GLX07489.1 hypothetical protein Misp03_44150 [Microbispora sp. NBRC 16548]
MCRPGDRDGGGRSRRAGVVGADAAATVPWGGMARDDGGARMAGRGGTVEGGRAAREDGGA